MNRFRSPVFWTLQIKSVHANCLSYFIAFMASSRGAMACYSLGCESQLTCQRWSDQTCAAVHRVAERRQAWGHEEGRMSNSAETDLAKYRPTSAARKWNRKWSGSQWWCTSKWLAELALFCIRNAEHTCRRSAIRVLGRFDTLDLRPRL